MYPLRNFFGRSCWSRETFFEGDVGTDVKWKTGLNCPNLYLMIPLVICSDLSWREGAEAQPWILRMLRFTLNCLRTPKREYRCRNLGIPWCYQADRFGASDGNFYFNIRPPSSTVCWQVPVKSNLVGIKIIDSFINYPFNFSIVLETYCSPVAESWRLSCRQVRRRHPSRADEDGAEHADAAQVESRRVVPEVRGQVPVDEQREAERQEGLAFSVAPRAHLPAVPLCRQPPGRRPPGRSAPSQQVNKTWRTWNYPWIVCVNLDFNG